MAVFESQWYNFPFNLESELVEIRARHYGIAQIDIYIKLFTDTAYPTSATVTLTPTSVGSTASSFATNLIFHASLFGNVYNPEAIRIKATGDVAVSPDFQRFIDVTFVIKPKRERKNNG